jgi:hypothetical protein
MSEPLIEELSEEPIEPIAVAKLTPTEDKQGHTVQVEPLQLKELPVAEEKMGWKVAAQLMHHWFSIRKVCKMDEEFKRDVYENPHRLSPEQYNDQIVTMAWAMQFKRVAEAVAILYNRWESADGVNLLRDRLKKAGWTPAKPTPTPLGYGLTMAHQLRGACQVNYEPVGKIYDSLDDFYGAVGRAQVQVAVVGSALGNIFTVERLGFYLYDTFDFEGDNQPLGVWSRNRCLGKIETGKFMTASLRTKGSTYRGFVPVYNRDFRRYQDKNKKGGDFVVYSDVYWARPKYPKIDLSDDAQLERRLSPALGGP